MVTIRSVNEIIQSLVDYFRLAQPDLDTKPGTVARDLVIDGPANQLALLYEEVSGVSDQQSLRLVSGSDLDKLAKNFGLTRKSATPASGVALLTFSSINAPININSGDSIIASNGLSYVVQNGIAISPALSNFYQSVASKFQNDLDFVGITDSFAVEITVRATSSGISGNLGKYSLIRTNISGVSNVTNVNPFTGGGDSETDAIFRDRVLSVFSGSSVGTALGYKNTALSTTGVFDAFIVEPGDTLMTRDGSIVTTSNDGTKTVISEGTGGKVDVVILGSSLNENIDSFIYRDKSNKNDPTDPKNIFVLGQITGDENKTINRKRIDNIKTGILPVQPVQEFLEVTGSQSGSNFVPKTVDSFGRVFGNFELLKDSGLYGGSPWGFDSFHWIDFKVSDFGEDRIKGQFNGQDALTFTDVLEIPNVQQNISITNENSLVTSDRSLIQLLHTPVTNVTRVFNVNTGERYVVSNQNPDGSGSTNTTGRIRISGNTLPSASDVLQVDYSWIVSYDQFSDYDGIINTKNSRPVNDSIDWGYSSLVRSEKVKFTRNTENTFFVGNLVQPISSIINVKQVNPIEGVVTEVLTGTFAGRLSIILNDLTDEIATIDEVVLSNTNTELYNTSQSDGVFSNQTTVVGIDIRFITTIILPTDTLATVDDKVTVFVNSSDTFNVTNSNGNFNGTQITIPTANIDSTATNIVLDVNYIANTPTLLSTTVPFLPVSRVGNGFDLSKNLGFNNSFITNTMRRDVLVIQQNLSLQLYIELNESSLETIINNNLVISVIRIVDGKEIWNSDNQGTITVNTSNNNYQLIFSGFNTPAIGDRVLVVYYANNTRRFQPFTFGNTVIRTNISSLSLDSFDNRFLTSIQSFISEDPVAFQILEPNSDEIIASGVDGYLISTVSNPAQAVFGSPSFSFSNIANISSKKVKIFGSSIVDNNGIFDIVTYNASNNSLTVATILDKISTRQVSVIRIADGKDLWSSTGIVDADLNLLAFPVTSAANAGDKVFVVFTDVKNLKQSSSKVAITVSDQVVNTGVLTIVGTTLIKASDVVFTATTNGLKQNILEAMRKALKLNSTSLIPGNIKLAKIAKLEKVNTVSIGSDEVLSVIATYDLTGAKLRDNSWFIEDFVEDTTLSDFEFILPGTANNLSNTSVLNNLPSIGDKLRITFYYSVTGDSENLYFTRNGTLYTNKNFGLIDRIFVASGFTTSQSTKIVVSTFNQPIVGSRYKAIYDYTAPKPNERIVIRYNYNKLITDVTFNIENNRPINADVLVRQAKEILVDLTMNIVISDTQATSSNLVVQNLKDRLLEALTINQLGVVIDASDLVNVAYTIDGVDRARILFFNKNGSTGQVLSLIAQKDEYFVPNNVIVNIENR